MTEAEKILKKHIFENPDKNWLPEISAMKEITELAFRAGIEYESLSRRGFQKEVISKGQFINQLFNEQL